MYGSIFRATTQSILRRGRRKRKTASRIQSLQLAAMYVILNYVRKQGKYTWRQACRPAGDVDGRPQHRGGGVDLAVGEQDPRRPLLGA